jgi:putative restriction endonuclease
VIRNESKARLDAIAHVLALRRRWHGAIPASELRQFASDEQAYYLKGIQGIFTPAGWSAPLSLLSTLSSPYVDAPHAGRVLYDFAPRSREADNNGLKRAHDEELPLIYLLQVKGKPKPEYEVFAPVYVVGWDDAARRFDIDLAQELIVAPRTDIIADASVLAKEYRDATVRRRLHQARFRNNVLEAYRDRCAVCVLRIRPLLDAAHIIADADPTESLRVSEGLALCATHHRAFDARIIRYDSDYRIHIELPPKTPVGEGEERMLVAFDGRPLQLPRSEIFWPIVV